MSEFRIFLPIIGREQIEQFPKSLFSCYIQRIQCILTTFGCHTLDNTDSTVKDERIDRYVVTDDHFGLKYRYGMKLEVKIRIGVNNHRNYIETWRKYKIRKKSDGFVLSNSDIDDIIELLSQHNVMKPTDKDMMITPSMVDVQKLRRNDIVGHQLVQEICLLKVGLDMDSNHVMERKVTNWFSFCLEGVDIKTINETFDSRAEYDDLKKAVIELYHIYHSSHPYTEIMNTLKIYPIISGYPTWIRTIMTPITEKDYIHSIVSDFVTKTV